MITRLTALERFRNATYLKSIDMLRGIAALMVVCYHFILGQPNRFIEFPLLQYIASYGHLGVQIFFVISGFVIPYSMYLSRYTISNFWKFILKRLIRLEPPYIVSIIVCLILAYAGLLNPYSRGAFPEISIAQVALHLGYLNAFFEYEWLNVVYWTLAIEFQYYLIIAVLYPLLLKDNRGWLLLTLGVSSVLTWALPYKQFFFLHAPFFWCGIGMFLFKIGRLNPQQAFVMIATNLCIVLVIQDTSYALMGLLPVVIIAFTSIESKIAVFLGSISYSIYLLHVPIGQRILNLSENFIKSSAGMLAMTIGCILIMIFTSWIFRICVEAPSHRLAKMIKY